MESEYFEAYRSLVSEVTNGMERVKQARAFNSSDEFLSRMEASYKEALIILNGSAPEEECQSVRSPASDPPDSSDYVCKVTQSNVSSGNPKKRKLFKEASVTVTCHNPHEFRDYVRKITRSNVSSEDPLKRELSQQVTVTSCNTYEMLDDGYSWRKYGTKSVLNSKYPRDYYRCANRGCMAKKNVERSEDDTFVVIYNGNHQCLVTQPPSELGILKITQSVDTGASTKILGRVSARPVTHFEKPDP